MVRSVNLELEKKKRKRIKNKKKKKKEENWSEGERRVGQLATDDGNSGLGFL